MPAKRIVYYDLLNIVACFCVVCLHANTMVHVYKPGLNWACGLVIEVVCYWAVPVFFMLSGATLMRYRDRYDTAAFFKRRLTRVLVPFVAWSLILYVLRFGLEHPSPDFGVREFVALFFTNGIEPIYWFFFPLIALYLAMPVLSLLADNRRILVYIAATAFALQTAAPPLFALAGIPWNASLSLPVAGGYVLYAVVGYLAATADIPRKYRIAIYALAIAAFVLRYAFTFASSSAQGAIDRTLFDYMQFTAFFPALAVFVWFRYHDWSRGLGLEGHAKRIAAISSCSFGVYLIHKIVLSDVLFLAFEVSPLSIALRTIGPVLIYLACLGVVYAIKRIPGLKMLVP